MGSYMEMMDSWEIKAFNFKFLTKFENISPLSYQETETVFNLPNMKQQMIV